jgi:hypothetical protein
MQRMFLLIVAIALLISSAANGQSLGDVARENREKQNANDASTAEKPRVITNKDLPKDPDANREPREAQPGSGAAPGSQAADYRSVQQRLAEQRAADRWKRLILAQEDKMATLQARIDQINESIRSVNGNVQYEGPYNRYQARQLERAARIQLQLDEQKKKLDEMQEAARHAGMHTAVYDP